MGRHGDASIVVSEWADTQQQAAGQDGGGGGVLLVVPAVVMATSIIFIVQPIGGSITEFRHLIQVVREVAQNAHCILHSLRTRRMQENARECKGMQENARECKGMQENARECKRMQGNARK